MSAARPCEAITAQSNETLTLVRHSRIENHMARVPVTTLYKALMHRQWSRRVVCVSVLLLLLSFVYNVAANDADYTQPGPCYFDENVYCEGGCASLKVKTTIPRNSGEGGCLAAPHPVVVFFDGYQVHTAVAATRQCCAASSSAHGLFCQCPLTTHADRCAPHGSLLSRQLSQ